MKTKSLLIAAIAASMLIAGAALAQRSGGGQQGAGRQAGTPPRAASPDRPMNRDDSMRPQQQPQPRADQVQQRAQMQEQMQANLAERLQQQSEFHRQLGLTPDQDAAIARIREQQRNEVQTINQRRLLTRSQKEKRVRETQEKHDQEIRNLLTPDQIRRMDELHLQDRDRLRDETRRDAPPKN